MGNPSLETASHYVSVGIAPQRVDDRRTVSL